MIHENAFVPALIEMADAAMPPVVVAGVGYVEFAHKFCEVALGGLDEQMDVVGHKDVTIELDRIDIE